MSETTYTIIAKSSGEQNDGGTNATVSIQLLDNDGVKTDWHVLDNFWYNDFQIGKTDTFTIKAIDVGLPTIIRLKLDKTADPDGWNCETVIVRTQSSEEVEFNVYDWVRDEVDVVSGKAELPHKESSKLIRNIRELELTKSKHIFRWNLVGLKSLPLYGSADTYEELPRIFRYNDIQYDNFCNHKKASLVNALVKSAKDYFFNHKVEDYDDYYSYIIHPKFDKERPPFHDRWHTDEEFGRQMLNGVNPFAISLCTKIPEQFLKEEKNIFPNGETLNDEVQAKRIFIIDYRAHTTGIPRNLTRTGEQLYCADSIALFQVQKSGKLLPIAILLEEEGEVFTPYDNEHDWMLAKLYFRNTDVSVHEWVYHLFLTHLAMEPVAVGLFRSLSRRHPLYKLLRPHVQTIPTINTLGRKNLIGPGASANYTLSLEGVELGRRAFELFEYEHLHIPNNLKARGVDDSNVLPLYHYREDALQLWSAIQSHAERVICQFYTMDEDVVKDFELKEFIRTVAEDGIASAGFGLKGYPTQLKTVDKLIEYVTIVIFTCSAQHAASNFGQFEIYKFIPNAPAGMRLPPHKKGEGSKQRILDALPDKTMTLLQLGTAFTLSAYSPNEVYLGEFPMKLFMNGEIDHQKQEFKKELKIISANIEERNNKLEIPYTYLIPERVPHSIAI